MISALVSLAFIAVSAIMTESVHEARHRQVKNHLKDKLEAVANARKTN